MIDPPLPWTRAHAKTVAVTGDDFGKSWRVNRAIAEAFDRGVLTHASLLVAGDAAVEAIGLARARPGLAVGLHLAVLDARAVLPPSDIPRLVNADGQFPRRAFRAGLRYQFSRAARRELRAEIRAQFERFAESGLALSHVDGHHHMHLHPVVLDIVTELAPEFGIRQVRLPSEELSHALVLDHRHVASKTFWSAVFRLLHRHGVRRLRQARIGYADRVYGLLSTGHVTEAYLIGLLKRIRADRVEIYCHPEAGLPGDASGQIPTEGEEELAALVSPHVRRALSCHGFVLARSAMGASIGPA